MNNRKIQNKNYSIEIIVKKIKNLRLNLADLRKVLEVQNNGQVWEGWKASKDWFYVLN